MPNNKSEDKRRRKKVALSYHRISGAFGKCRYQRPGEKLNRKQVLRKLKVENEVVTSSKVSAKALVGA